MNPWVNGMILVMYLIVTSEELNKKADTYGSCSMPVIAWACVYIFVLGMWVFTEIQNL